ncbi:hypothetical protein JVT61DRAFT_8581 [Boletus reticuloceps]|uniref:Transmembrane protein n=1 Tax=Boletus reticuloceps TaxID=495285 RepID=A0A8I2YZE4_9AGAM|nr:hypothetical protein JVT61DRAFT_8581 [Boletus reticuloceps]
MPLVTNVIDDKSPLISYDSSWLSGTAQDDPFASDHYLGTFAKNNVTDGSLSFNFNGTAVWIYGDKRPYHGSYTVQVDSATYPGLNGSGNYVFEQSIFNISSLSQEMHTVRLTNTASGGLYVVVDMIVWQSQVGNTGDQLISEVVQDTDSRFRYQEPAWSTTSSDNINFGLFSNGTGHVTQTYDATVTFTFTTVQYNASTIYPTNYGLMIYHADNLGPGSHQLVLTNLPATSGQSICIDYAQLWTLVNTGTPLPNTSDVSHNKLSSGAIAGIVVAVVAAVLSAGAALFFYRRWKAAMATQRDLYRAITPQQRLLASATVAPSSLSSSLETSNIAKLSQNDTSIQILSARLQQLANNDAAQYDSDAVVPAYPPVASGPRDSRSIVPPTQSAVDEAMGRIPLSEAPTGGKSLADGFQNSRIRNVVKAS